MANLGTHVYVVMKGGASSCLRPIRTLTVRQLSKLSKMCNKSQNQLVEPNIILYNIFPQRHSHGQSMQC